MIAPQGLFHFRVIVSRDSRGYWSGRAGPSLNQVPGIVGNHPDVVLRDDVLWLTRTQPVDCDTLMSDGKPVVGFLVWVGPAVAPVVESGDEFLVLRDDCGCCGLVVSRKGALVIALGSVDHELAPFGVGAEVDPRAEEVDLYGVLDMLARPGTRLIWLDPMALDFPSVLDGLDHLPEDVKCLVFAARGNRGPAMSELNRRVMNGRARGRSSWFINIPERFRTEAEWLDYLRTLPESRPTDLVVRFTVDGRTTAVGEKACAFVDPWHFAVKQVFTPGLPGDPTLVGVARAHPALSADDFRKSALACGNGHIQ